MTTWAGLHVLCGLELVESYSDGQGGGGHVPLRILFKCESFTICLPRDAQPTPSCAPCAACQPVPLSLLSLPERQQSKVFPGKWKSQPEWQLHHSAAFE